MTPGLPSGLFPGLTLVVIATDSPARVEEALRAALGLTLRGAAVEVWLPSSSSLFLAASAAAPLAPAAPAAPALTATAARALGVLQSFGHTVRPPGTAAELAAAAAVEVWT